MSTTAHEVVCPICKALPMDCRCSLESLLNRAGRGPQAHSPQQTMTSLREMRESLAALVTEVRGLREGLDKLMQSHAALETQATESLISLFNGNAETVKAVGRLVDAWDGLVQSKRRRAKRRK